MYSYSPIKTLKNNNVLNLIKVIIETPEWMQQYTFPLTLNKTNLMDD